MNPLLLHINYFEPHTSLEEACRIARELGVDGIEFRRKRTSPAQSTQNPQADLDYLDELSLARDRHCLSTVSFGTPGINLMIADPAEREKEIERGIAFYREAARRFPLTVINFQTGAILNPDPAIPGAAYARHGSGAAAEWHWSAAIEGLRTLIPMVEELGLTLGLETHPCYLHDTLETTNRLVAAVNHPSIGILWDQTNLMVFDQPAPPLEAALEQIRGSLVNVHLKNFLLPPVEGGFVVSALSDGIVDIRHQIALLRASNYTGPICLESPRLGDRRWFAQADVEYFRAV